MKLGRRSLLLAGAALPASAYAQCVTDMLTVDACMGGVRSIVPPPAPSLDLSFLTSTLDASITWTRANNNATTGTFLDPSGASFSTVLQNIPRIDASNGLLIEPFRTNLLLNSSAPATQTTASLAIGSYSLWVNGSGSATPSAATAIGNGFAAATQGNPSTFNITTAGTVTVTVAGALNRFQLEAGVDATSYVPTTAATVLRQIDSGTLPTAAWYNASEGSLVCEFLQPQVVNVSDETPSLYTDANNNFSVLLQNGNVFVRSIVANVVTSMQIPGTVTPRVVQKVGFAWQASTLLMSGCLNGGLVNGIGVPSFPAVNQIKFGAVRINTLNGFCRRLRCWPKALTQSQLQAVTT